LFIEKLKLREMKQCNIFLTTSLIEKQRQKEQFLYEFNTSGKYKILKDKLKHNIRELCLSKFEKAGSLMGVKKDMSDIFYCDLYTFLIEETRLAVAE